MVRYLPAHRRLSSNVSVGGAFNNGSSDKDETDEPELYRLVRARNGRDVDWTAVRERLRSLADDEDDDDGDAVAPASAVRSELLWTHPLTGVTSLHVLCCWRPPPSVVALYVRMCPPSVWARSHNGSTALHSACGNGASPDVVRALLEAAADDENDDDVDGGAPRKTTPCEAHGDERLKSHELEADETMSSSPSAVAVDTGGGGDRKVPPPKASRSGGGAASTRLALLRTYDRNWTALHCACRGSGTEASLPVLRLLLDVAPGASALADHDLVALGRTPLDALCGNYESLARRYVQDAAAAAAEEEEDDDVDVDDSVLPWRDHAPNDSLRHFWTKACLLVRTAASVVEESSMSTTGREDGRQYDHRRRATSSPSSSAGGGRSLPRRRRRDGGTKKPRRRRPIVHAMLSLPSSCPCPPILLRLALLSFPRQFALFDDNDSGDLPLHVACRNVEPSMRPIISRVVTGDERRQSFALRSSSSSTSSSSSASPDNDADYVRETAPLDVLLRRYPGAASVPSGRDGLLPLQIVAREAAALASAEEADAGSSSSPSLDRRRMRMRSRAVRRVLFADPSAAASSLLLDGEGGGKSKGGGGGGGICNDATLYPFILRLLSADPDVGDGDGDGENRDGARCYSSSSSPLGNVFALLRAKPDLLLLPPPLMLMGR
mmetsp:Transcript_12083/g.35257  ORF Transcript_12083/g.35257 Transcript_12083/m.35257 type:complete len:665 (-) Transcript_12083:433-2427(-)